jgi:hypothetical protein
MMIRVVYPGSGFRLFTHPGSRIQGSKRHWIQNLGSGTLLFKPNAVLKSLDYLRKDIFLTFSNVKSLNRSFAHLGSDELVINIALPRHSSTVF